MKKKVVAVAGFSEPKVNGTVDGLAALVRLGIERADMDVRSVAVPENKLVPPQPFGLVQTREGATFRAQAALDADPEADYGVGIENGVDDLGDGHGDGIDFPVVAIATRVVTGNMHYATGMGIQVPARFIRASRDSGWRKTCGSFIAQETGFSPVDWHAGYTDGITCRQEIIAATVALAFTQLFRGR